MSYVQINVKKVGTPDELKEWEDHMFEKAKCWNQFCLGLCGEHELRAVHVVKDGNEEHSFLTTLCEDCIKDTSGYGILVNENHLVVESKRK